MPTCGNRGPWAALTVIVLTACATGSTTGTPDAGDADAGGDTAPDLVDTAADPDWDPVDTAVDPDAHADTAEDEIEDLLESAIDRPTRSAAAARASGPIVDELPTSSLPGKPSRKEVVQVMERVAELVRRCGGEAYSKVTVQLAVNGDTGRVTGARAIDREYAGTPVGSCAARAVRSAKFPRFAQDKLVIKYPFDL